MKLTVENKKLHEINPDMFGLFFEDINYAADGGLYAEMIENRSFEFFRTTGVNDAYSNEYDGIYGWYKYPKDCPFVALETRTVKPAFEENPHYLHIRTRRANSGFTNKSYDGLSLVAGEKYKGQFYMNAPLYNGEIIVAVEKDKDVFWSCAFTVSAEDKWKNYTYEFISDITVRGAKLVIKLSVPGEADFDFISLFPANAVSGVFRKDLAEKLRDLKPGFLRFPGGCIVEGNNLENRYQWKHSVGAPERRHSNWNRWAVHGNGKENNYTSKYAHYNQTYGLGFFEYFLLCEYIGAKALPVVNVGLACQYQCNEWVETTDPAFREYIDDALDLIEFANGDVNTKWGSLRAEMGHPAPFNLTMMGIGNEQWQTEKVDFFERYRLFEAAVHEKYPEMLLIGSAGPDVHTERYDAAWKFYRENKNKKNFAYAIDEHYYMAPEWFLENTHFYDDYDRDVKVFSGEYAAHPKRIGSEKSGNTLMGVLSEAAFLTGVARNSDVVIMSSYAPLFAREGYVQWAPDMIWFDDSISYGTPSFYVQKMFSNNTGTHLLKSAADDNAEEKGIFSVTTYDEKSGEVIVKLVNTKEEEIEVTIDTNAFGDKKKAEITVLGGEKLSPSAFNSIECPDKVKAFTYWPKASDRLTLPGLSFTVARYGFKEEVAE